MSDIAFGALGVSTQKMLRWGDGWDDSSEVSRRRSLIRLVNGMCAAGLTLTEAHALLRDDRNRGGQKVYAWLGGWPRVRRYVNAVWADTVRFQARNRQTYDGLLLDVLVGWRFGSQPSAAFRVLLALLDLARSLGPRFDVSASQLAERASVGTVGWVYESPLDVACPWLDTSAVCKALETLDSLGVHIMASPDDDRMGTHQYGADRRVSAITSSGSRCCDLSEASSLRQIVTREVTEGTSPSFPIRERNVITAVVDQTLLLDRIGPFHPVWEWLGVSALRVFAALVVFGPLRTGELASRLAVARGTTASALSVLERVGLVCRDGRAWAVSGDAVAVVAERFGVTDRRALRRAANVDQRQRFHVAAAAHADGVIRPKVSDLGLTPFAAVAGFPRCEAFAPHPMSRRIWKAARLPPSPVAPVPPTVALVDHLTASACHRANEGAMTAF